MAKETKQSIWHRADTEKPCVGTVVTIEYLSKGIKGYYTAMWIGTQWLIRKPYSRNDFEPLPDDIDILAWSE